MAVKGEGGGGPKKDHTKAESKVLRCSCRHEYQDAQYGVGMRLHNPCSGHANSIAYRCTVCSKTVG